MTAQPPTDQTTDEPWTRSGPGSPAPTGPYAPPPVTPPGAPPPVGPPPVDVPASPERPKRRWGPILGGAVGAIVAAIVVAVVVRPGSDSMPSVDKWTTFSDPEGRFTVSMPKEPERTTQQAPAGTVTLDVITYTADYGDSAVVVGYTDYPQDLQLGAPEDVLDGAVQGAAEGTEGTVISSTPTTVGGLPAIDSETQVEQGRVLSRFLLDDRRLYILSTVAKESRSDIQRHLTDSFTLTGG